MSVSDATVASMAEHAYEEDCLHALVFEKRRFVMLTRLDWNDAHKIVAARAGLAEVIERFDARLRELDGRATAGNPSLRVGLEKP
jgi:hypothetical protein